VKIGLKIDSMEQHETALGNFGTEGKNERGKQLLRFLLENGQYQMNSFSPRKNTNKGFRKAQTEK